MDLTYNEEVARSAEAMRAYSCEHLREWWDLLISRVSGDEEGFGLFGPSSYLLHIGDARLLVDPYLRPDQDIVQLSDRLCRDLAKLDGVILTHEHGDHYDPVFLSAAAEADVRWFVPDFFHAEKLAATGIPAERIVHTAPGMTVQIGADELYFFESNHRNEGAEKYVLEYGFSLRSGGRQYVFPGDVRTYDPSFYPPFENTEILFAHLWLGRGAALKAPWEPKLTEYCDFLQSFGAQRITIAHLYEVRRKQTDMWQYRHAGAVMDRMISISPGTEINILRPGVWYTI